VVSPRRFRLDRVLDGLGPLAEMSSRELDGFPLDFSTGEAIMEIVGWFLAGLVLAAIVRPGATKPTVA
jgi:hypothetical protein